jgi:hypothetical protein
MGAKPFDKFPCLAGSSNREKDTATFGIRRLSGKAFSWRITYVNRDAILTKQRLKIPKSLDQKVSSRLTRYCAGLHGQSATGINLYHRLFRLTGEAVFFEASSYWTEETLLKAVAYNAEAGYLSSEANSKVNNRELLAGISGIGLTLLSLKTESYLLDDFFMLKNLYQKESKQE